MDSSAVSGSSAAKVDMLLTSDLSFANSAGAIEVNQQ